MTLTLISKHGAYIRGALLAFASGALPIVINLASGRPLTIIDLIAALLSGIVSLASFADKTNAELGATWQMWIKGTLYVIGAILTNLLALLQTGKPLNWALFVAATVPAVNLVIRQYMDKSLSFATLLKPTPAQALTMLPPRMPSPFERAAAAWNAGRTAFKGDGSTDEPAAPGQAKTPVQEVN